MLPLFCLPILGINDVYAQESTNTPTWQPLFPTGTPRPTINSNCPDGQPSGWGTVTPSFNWLNYCSHCIGRPTADWSDIDQQVTPWPEEYITHLGNCTIEELDEGCEIITHGAGLACQCLGYPTPTPNGTPTVTEIGLFTVDLGTINHSATADFYSNVTNRFGGVNVCGEGNYFLGLYLNGQISVTPGTEYAQIILWHNNSDYPWTFNSNGWYNSYNSYTSGTYNFEMCFSGGESNHYIADDQVFGINNTQFPCYDLYGEDVPYLAKFVDKYDVEKNYDNFWVMGGYYNPYSVNLQAEAMCWGVPVIDIPDTGSDYCNQVEPKPVYEADEVGFELPTPSYGVGQCVVFGFEIGLGWLENLFPNLFQFPVPESLGIPNFQICVRPITFGDLNIFGILIDIDYLLLAASVIMVVRWLFRS